MHVGDNGAEGLRRGDGVACGAEGRVIEKLSVFIIVKNEEDGIRRCLESVAWADEIIIVDSGSTDATESICREFTDSFIFHEWESSNRQKQFAMDQCSNLWALSVDADEVVSPELRKSIENMLSGDSKCSGYKFLRRNYYKDIPLNFGAMHPKPELRLFRRDQARFKSGAVHDKIILDGPRGWLKGYLEHYNITDMAEWVEKNVRYARLSAEDDFARGKRVTWRHFAGLLFLFLRRYILWRGFLHGRLGLFFSAMPVFFRLHQYTLTRELQEASRWSGESFPRPSSADSIRQTDDRSSTISE